MTDAPDKSGMRTRDSQAPAVLLSFALALGLLGALLYVVGVDAVVVAVVTADSLVLGALAVVVACWVGAWSGSLLVVLRALDLPHPLGRTALVYASMMFWDNVSPFSTVAADPVAAGVLSRTFDVEYERSLAAVVTVDFLNFLPSPLFAAVGLLFAGTTAVLPGLAGTTLASLATVLLLVSLGGALAWRERRRLAATAAEAAVAVDRTLRRIVPGATERVEPTIRTRVETLLAQLERVAASRRTLVVALALATAGWFLLSLAFWLSLFAVGVVVPVGAALFAVPLVTVVELTPLPGGVGGLEPLLVVVVAVTTGDAVAAVTAGVLVFRLATHWGPTVVGGAAVPILWYR